jgi:hypothetical protein
MKRLRYLAIVLAAVSGCGSGSKQDTYEGNKPATNGLVGDPCNTVDDCKPTEGARPVCMTESKGMDTWDWIGGYCTFGCNTKNPKCPTGTICSSVGYQMEGQRCLSTCNSDADCRTPYYRCSSGVCESNTKAGTTPPGGADSNFGNTCEQESDCSGADECILTLHPTKGMCAARCAALGATCATPDGKTSKCSAGSAPNFYCMYVCQDSSQCPDPATQQCVDGAGHKFCVPK